MTKLSAGQKRKQKELRRKKRHKQPGSTFLAHDFDSDSRVASYGESGLKLSSIIFDYAEPLLDGLGESEDDQEEMEEILSMAILYWNIGTLPDDQNMSIRQQLLDDMAE